MKDFTDNKTYVKYWYKIAHAYDVATLESLRWDVTIDVEIDTFDMVYDLYDKINEKIRLVKAW